MWGVGVDDEGGGFGGWGGTGLVLLTILCPRQL